MSAGGGDRINVEAGDTLDEEEQERIFGERSSGYDPTRSKTRRDRWAGKFRRRGRRLRGIIRREWEGGSVFRPDAPGRRADKITEFNRWARTVVDEEVVEPTPERDARNGDHYTAPFVRELYEHGVREGNRRLRLTGYDVPDTDPATVIQQGGGDPAMNAFARADAKRRRRRLRTPADDVLTADDPTLDPGLDTEVPEEPVNRLVDQGLIHNDALAGGYVDVFSDVEKIGRDTVDALELAYNELLAARDPVAEQIALLNGNIESVVEDRMSVMAQTRAVDLVNQGAINRYAEVGVEEVGVDVELDVRAHLDGDELEMFQTAGDDRVCPECAQLSGNVYKIKEIMQGVHPRGIQSGPNPRPPLHPNCRCFFIPIPIENRDWPHGAEAAPHPMRDAESG